MNRAEAAKILELELNTDASAVLARYAALHQDYQARLVSAPTASLRKAYQKRLQDMRTACEVLQPGAVGELAPDLPVVERVGVNPPARGPSNLECLSSALSSRGQQAAGLPRSTILAAVAAVMFATTTSLLAILWLKTRQTDEALSRVVTAQSAQLKSMTHEIAATNRLLQVRHLDVCNRSIKPVRIEAVVAMYRDGDGKLRSVHTGLLGYPHWDVRPASRVSIDVVRGSADDWDGSATFYAMQVLYDGAEPFLMAGVISDLKDGCVNLYLD